MVTVSSQRMSTSVSSSLCFVGIMRRRFFFIFSFYLELPQQCNLYGSPVYYTCLSLYPDLPSSTCCDRPSGTMSRGMIMYFKKQLFYLAGYAIEVVLCFQVLTAARIYTQSLWPVDFFSALMGGTNIIVGSPPSFSTCAVSAVHTSALLCLFCHCLFCFLSCPPSLSVWERMKMGKRNKRKDPKQGPDSWPTGRLLADFDECVYIFSAILLIF